MKNIMDKIKQKSNYIGYGSFFALLVWLLMSQIETVAGLVSKIVLILGLLGVALYAGLEKKKILVFFSGKRTKKKLRVSATMFLVAGILVMLYYVAARRNILRIDMTTNKLFSLSDQTTKMLKNLKQDVKITVFKMEPQDMMTQQLLSYSLQMFDLLKEYHLNNNRVKVALVDMQEEPALTKTYDIKSPGIVVIEVGKSGKKKVLTVDDYIQMKMVGRKPQPVPNYEAAVTTALLSLTRKATFTVYFTKGHGELAPLKSDVNGISITANALKQEGITVKTVNLLIKKPFPLDCDLLVVAGGTDNLAKSEQVKIDSYLNNGNPVVFLADIDSSRGLKQLISRWGVIVHKDVIVDPERAVAGMGVVTPDFVYHPINKQLAESGRRVVFVLAASLSKNKKLDKNEYYIRPILQTGEKAWGETDLKVAKMGPNERKGKLPVGYAIEKKPAMGKTKSTRVVVFGDADFIRNGYLERFTGNKDFFLNAVNWALHQEKNITIRAKSPVINKMTLTEGEMNFMRIFVIFIMPLLVILPGIFVYARRKRNG